MHSSDYCSVLLCLFVSACTVRKVSKRFSIGLVCLWGKHHNISAHNEISWHIHTNIHTKLSTHNQGNSSKVTHKQHIPYSQYKVSCCKAAAQFKLQSPRHFFLQKPAKKDQLRESRRNLLKHRISHLRQGYTDWTRMRSDERGALVRKSWNCTHELHTKCYGYTHPPPHPHQMTSVHPFVQTVNYWGLKHPLNVPVTHSWLVQSSPEFTILLSNCSYIH